MLRLYVEESCVGFMVRRRFSKAESAKRYAKEMTVGKAYITDDSYTTKNRLGVEVPHEMPIWTRGINIVM